MAPSLKLFYFNMTGRAEPIRLALTIGGVEFEDVRLTKDEFMAKKTDGSLPLGSLPVLEVDGKTVCQSYAIQNYCAKLAGLYPKDDFVGMKAEEVSFCIEDLGQLVYATFSEQDLDTKIAKRKELVEGKLGEKIAALNALMEKNGKKMSVSDELSIADIHLYAWCTLMTSGWLDGIPTDLFAKHGKITECCKAVAEHPKVIAWNEARAAAASN